MGTLVSICPFFNKNSAVLHILHSYFYQAMQSQVKLGKVRTPTDAWSGLGFSNSMPEAAIKELVSFLNF